MWRNLLNGVEAFEQKVRDSSNECIIGEIKTLLGSSEKKARSNRGQCRGLLKHIRKVRDRFVHELEPVPTIVEKYMKS